MNQSNSIDNQNQNSEQRKSKNQNIEHSSEELDLRELLQKLNRRRKAIFSIFLLVVVMTGLYLYQAVPRYTASAQLTLDLRQSRVVDIEEVLSGITADASVIGTEIDTIRSSSLLGKVVDKLRLDLDPEYNSDILARDEEKISEKIISWIRSLWFLDSGIEEELSPEEEAVKLKTEIIRKLQDNLELDHRRQSHTITLSFTSESPKRAAQVANTIADLYLTDQLEAKFEATRRANEWLSERLESMRQEVLAAEQAVKNVRERSEITQVGGTTILEQQLSNINAQLIEARVKRSRAEARLSQATDVMSRPGGIESLGEVLDSRTIQQLRTEETSLRRRKAELSQRYGSRHPQMIQIEAEMSDLQEKLKEEANRILQSLENEVQVARAEERTLQASLTELRSDAGRVMDAELELRELERQAQSSRTLYQSFLSRFQETREQDALQRPDARIISRAETPIYPSYPRKKMTLGLGAMAGLMFGVMGAFILETLDRGYRTSAQVEKDTGISVLGAIPLMGRTQGTPVEYVLKKQFSSLAESLRAIRTAVHLSNVDHPPRSIMVTSSLPKEGKSSFSAALGRVSAMSGVRTLVIDADLRRPSQASFFPDVQAEYRLEDVLQGKIGIKEAIVKDSASGLHLLLAHGKAPAVGEMLGSQKMKSMIDKLEEHYELVILDTPPIMGVSDAWGLARYTDSVVFSVKWAETPRETVKAALRQMEVLDIEVGGVIMSMVNVRQQAKYGYGGYGYYYGKYKKYYNG
ncbi:MAG: polysaccharide biosynthesis tyrosine autokinase [Desulfonatronovibrio sp. MSAO_Bac4]|nr:MAG: polysaccharide biosynthesis tyrosine autokinase [Desulfonatronovibrio sp. MSAO_Bac4]